MCQLNTISTKTVVANPSINNLSSQLKKLKRRHHILVRQKLRLTFLHSPCDPLLALPIQPVMAGGTFPQSMSSLHVTSGRWLQSLPSPRVRSGIHQAGRPPPPRIATRFFPWPRASAPSRRLLRYMEVTAATPPASAPAPAPRKSDASPSLPNMRGRLIAP